MRSTLKKVASVLALAAVMTACGADDGAAQDGAEEWSTDFTRHTIPLDEIVSGGPPKDGIPAIDRPRYVPVAEARAWLRDKEPVLVVEGGSVVRAYPYQVLIWHEIVNDDVAALPLAVTYCPLCNTALVFRREHGGRILDFGTTGRVRHSDLVMYDRQTESWWQQATGEAIVGELAGERLEAYPARTASWREFRESHPQGEVLSRETGFDRPYGRNPYVGYDRRSGPIAPVLPAQGGRTAAAHGAGRRDRPRGGRRGLSLRAPLERAHGHVREVVELLDGEHADQQHFVRQSGGGE